jgi:hypothetical protein
MLPLFAVIVLTFAGCGGLGGQEGKGAGQPAAPGAYCTVQFKRDVLGASRELPVSPRTGSINGAKVSVSGKFLRMTESWLVIHSADSRGAIDENRETWIPFENILLFEVTKKNP